MTDNTDLLLLREALADGRAAGVVGGDRRAGRVRRDSTATCPAWRFTHLQPAQPTTVGKRACLWAYDLVLDLAEIEHRLGQPQGPAAARAPPARRPASWNCSTATTPRSAGWRSWSAARSASTPPTPSPGRPTRGRSTRQVLGVLSGVAQSAHKMATDLRLLAHRKEVEEPFEKEQIGSSAMAYKRNPMRSERICSLARFVMSLESSAAQTAAVQWLERTLDDSANRRLVAAAGVPGDRRRADPLPERGRRAGGLSEGDRRRTWRPNCPSWPRRTS